MCEMIRIINLLFIETINEFRMHIGLVFTKYGDKKDSLMDNSKLDYDMNTSILMI